MIYNPQTPIAVFLGPSLERSYAYRILIANYYPPARLGDIYRLLGSGVRIIVLIDGIFHSAASIWQREILEALENNITVIGASSMGALRASELYPFGMIGYGTIFEWYRDKIIEGDDEVVLFHADESSGFRPFSEPLVNIRYNLLQAESYQFISKQQRTALTEFAKKTYYGNRSYPFLFNSPLFRNWPPHVQAHLIQFIAESDSNLKRQDAIRTLKFCSMLQKVESPRIASSLSLRHRGDYYKLVRYSHRGFLHPTGYLIRGEILLTEVRKNSELIKKLRSTLAKNYFLLIWIKQRAIRVPVDYSLLYQRQWENKYIHIDMDQWLRNNGLTKHEFQAILAERASLAWIIEQKSAFFDFNPYIHFAEVLLALAWKRDNGLITPEHENTKATQFVPFLQQLTELCYLVTWAADNGITCPDETVAQFIAKWEEDWQIYNRASWLIENNMSEEAYLALLAKWACYDWIIGRGPIYFGYTTWSFELSLIQELQITGQAAQIIERLDRNEFELRSQ